MKKKCVEIGYDFSSKYWNQGYASEAENEVKNYAIEKLKIEKQSICSFIHAHNKASQRVSEKIDMENIKEYKANDINYYLYGLSKGYFM